MTTRSPLSKYVQIDTSPTRVARVWVGVNERLRFATPYRRWPTFAVAGLLLGVATMALVLWPRTSALSGAVALPGAAIETSSASMKLDLGDEAGLELAARSRLELISSESRLMAFRLRRGVVSCALPPRSFRRFSIFVADLEVRVTGTEFKVSQDATTGRVEVNVIRGSVVVYGPGELANGRNVAGGERWSAERDLGRAAARESDNIAGADSAASGQAPMPSNSADGSTDDRSGDAADGAASTPAADGSTAAPSTVGSAPLKRSRFTPSGSDAPEIESAATWFDRANTARRAGDLDGAARAYQTLLSRFPDDAHADLAAFELGRLRLTTLGDIAGAIRAFRLAVTRTHNVTLREDAMSRLVEAFAKSGQLAECRSMRSTYLRSFPKGVHAAVVERYCL